MSNNEENTNSNKDNNKPIIITIQDFQKNNRYINRLIPIVVAMIISIITFVLFFNRIIDHISPFSP